MKAFVYKKYGIAGNLKIEEVPLPEPKPDEVRIRIKAISINSWDWDLLTGKPKVYRLMFGLTKPKYPIPGIDAAGEIDKVGDKVTGLKPGDAVYGDLSPTHFGTYAQYVCTRPELLALKPSKMSFEDAAALPHAGFLAYQGLLKYGPIKAGQEILINGAGGGVGTLGLQMAKHWGARVTCVDKGYKLDMLKLLGADALIDYTKDDFTASGKKYDFILDPVAKHPFRHYNRSLKKGGKFVMIGGNPGLMIKLITVGLITNAVTKKNLSLLPYTPNVDDLNTIGEMCTSGIIKPVIEKVYRFEEIPQAITHLGEGKVMGKLVVRIS